MIIFTGNWTRLNLSCTEFCDIAHDAVMPLEFVLQNGEIKLPVNSSKFFRDGELDSVDDGEYIPYCLHVTGIESFEVSTDGHPELFVTEIELKENELHVVGMNGEMRYSGRNIAVSFLRDDYSFASPFSPQTERDCADS